MNQENTTPHMWNQSGWSGHGRNNVLVTNVCLLLRRSCGYTLHIIHKLYERLGYGRTNRKLLLPMLLVCSSSMSAIPTTEFPVDVILGGGGCSYSLEITLRRPIGPVSARIDLRVKIIFFSISHFLQRQKNSSFGLCTFKQKISSSQQ